MFLILGHYLCPTRVPCPSSVCVQYVCILYQINVYVCVCVRACVRVCIGRAMFDEGLRVLIMCSLANVVFDLSMK